MKVLIVDDDEIVLAVTRRYLQRHGRNMDVCTCTSPGEAPALMQAWHPDVVLLDVNMPGVDGLELLNGLLRIAPGLPILMYTSWCDPYTRAACLHAGARLVLDKPLRPADVPAICGYRRT